MCVVLGRGVPEQEPLYCWSLAFVVKAALVRRVLPRPNGCDAPPPFFGDVLCLLFPLNLHPAMLNRP
jgi:hypothetical protein